MPTRFRTRAVSLVRSMLLCFHASACLQLALCFCLPLSLTTTGSNWVRAYTPLFNAVAFAHMWPRSSWLSKVSAYWRLEVAPAVQWQLMWSGFFCFSRLTQKYNHVLLAFRAMALNRRPDDLMEVVTSFS